MSDAQPTFYRYIVVGCGGVGSGALYWLSRRAGKDVLGLEQFSLGHENGGSQDHSRIIRLMYHDDRYTKLTPHTYKAWEEVERESGIQLVYKTGGLELTHRDTDGEMVARAYEEAMKRHNIPFERWNAAQIRRRYPQFTIPDSVQAVYQADGGLVDAAMANSVHVQLARAHGATVKENEPLTRVEPQSNGQLLVHTAKGVYCCEKLIVTAGAWINHVLGSLGVHIPITVSQEQVTYFSTPHVKEFTKEKCPIWIFNENQKDYYFLPSHGNSFSKIGIDAGGPPVTVDTRTFTPDPVREKLCVDFLKRHMPKALGPIAYSKTCLYTMTRDRDFIVDTLKHKGLPNVVVCCGAGHAYKFASLLGKILSELAIDGRTSYDVSGFPINRPAVNDPTFKPTHLMGLQIKSQLEAKL